LLVSWAIPYFGLEGRTMEQARPLDALNRARDKRVIVDLKNQKQLIGTLKAFDIHINCVLEDVEEKVAGETTRKMGTVFVRGDTIVTLSVE
jgi:small nuclear ribonucleoprotein